MDDTRSVVEHKIRNLYFYRTKEEDFYSPDLIYYGFLGRSEL